MRIIINADDFGISRTVNSSILRLHEKGIISSASIMAQGKFFEEAVSIANNNPALGIGVHLCLDGDMNIGKNYKTLLRSDSQKFYTIQEISKKKFRLPFDADEIFREYCLQIEKVKDYGISISHLDHHHHLHLFWPILKQVIRAAKKYRIPSVRSQKIILHRNYNVLNDFYRNIHQFYLKRIINTSDGCFETGITMEDDCEFFYERLGRLLAKKNTIPEIILHPDGSDDQETMIFSGDRLYDMLSCHEIINYHELNKHYSHNPGKWKSPVAKLEELIRILL